MWAPDTGEINGKAKEVSWWKNNLATAHVEWAQASEKSMNQCQSGCWPVQLETLIQDFQREMPNLEKINILRWDTGSY